MDLSFGAEYEKFRDEVKAFLAANWSKEDAAVEAPVRSRLIRHDAHSLRSGAEASGNRSRSATYFGMGNRCPGGSGKTKWSA